MNTMVKIMSFLLFLLCAQKPWGFLDSVGKKKVSKRSYYKQQPQQTHFINGIKKDTTITTKM